MSLKDFLDVICNDQVDEVRILKKIFAAYDGTFEASLTVSTACNASIHKTSWAQVVRHASKGKNADDIVRDANVLVTKERKQGHVDPLLKICAEFTSRIFHSNLSFMDGLDAFGQVPEMLNELQGQIDKISILKAYAQVQEDFQDFNAKLYSWYGEGNGLGTQFDPYKRSLARLRKSAGNAFIEAYQSRDHFVAPKRITIDDFVNTLQDCDIRLAANMNIDAGVSGGWWSNREDKVGEYVETGREDEDKKKKQLGSSVESEQVGGGQDINYQEQIQSQGELIVTLQRDLGIVSNDLADQILKLRQEVSQQKTSTIDYVDHYNDELSKRISATDGQIRVLRQEASLLNSNIHQKVDQSVDALTQRINATDERLNTI